MSTLTETEPRPVRAARPEAKALVLFAVIKASSKYAYQNREVNGKPVPMDVRRLDGKLVKLR